MTNFVNARCVNILFSRNETLSIPVGELLSLIAVHQIKLEGMKIKKTQEDEETEFFELLNWR